MITPYRRTTIGKITHMWRRCGTPQNFFLAFIDDLEKQLLKKLLKWVNKKQNNFNVYNVAYFFNKENTCRYHYQNLDDIIYSSWDIEQNILKLYWNHFTLPSSQKSKFWKKMKKTPEILSFYKYMCTINADHMIYMWFLKYKVLQTEIFVILGHFLPFQLLDTLENQNFNIEKNTRRYHFTHL